MRSVALSEKVYPKLLDADWVAPNATVVGSVEAGEGSSLWHGVVLRGDKASIKIGKNTIIQDRALITSETKDLSTKVEIGDSVYIGANTVVTDATLESFSYVGPGCTIGKGATVESFGMVAAGSHLTEGTVVPSGQVFAGSPAQYLRDLTQEEKHMLSEYKQEMQQMAQIYNEETEKDFREWVNDQDMRAYRLSAEPHELVADKLRDAGYPVEQEDMELIEHRVQGFYYGGLEFDNIDNHKPYEDNEGWNPYEQDLSLYPEIFKMYGENFDRYERAK